MILKPSIYFQQAFAHSPDPFVMMVSYGLAIWYHTSEAATPCIFGSHGTATALGQL